MSTSGSITSCQVVCDTAGYFGQTSDLPGKGYYQLTSVIEGAAGDGVTPGGWMVASHFVPLKPTATQTSVSADLLQAGGTVTAGSRQAPNTANDSCPFFADLVNVGTSTWQPAVTDPRLGGQRHHQRGQLHRLLGGDPPVLRRVGSGVGDHLGAGHVHGERVLLVDRAYRGDQCDRVPHWGRGGRRGWERLGWRHRVRRRRAGRRRVRLRCGRRSPPGTATRSPSVRAGRRHPARRERRGGRQLGLQRRRGHRHRPRRLGGNRCHHQRRRQRGRGGHGQRRHHPP